MVIFIRRASNLDCAVQSRVAYQLATSQSMDGIGIEPIFPGLRPGANPSQLPVRKNVIPRLSQARPEGARLSPKGSAEPFPVSRAMSLLGCVGNDGLQGEDSNFHNTIQSRVGCQLPNPAVSRAREPVPLV